MKKLLILLLIHICYSFNLYANILYSKNDIIITDIDLRLYRDYYQSQYGDELNKFQLIKNIVLIKKIIEKLINNNPKIIQFADQIIIEQLGEKVISNSEMRDFNRFVIIKNEYIKEYFEKNIEKNDLVEVVDKIKNSKIALSLDNCFTVQKYLSISRINDFEEIIFKKITNQNQSQFIKFNNISYEICFDNKINYEIETEFMKFMESEVFEGFNKLIYE